MSCRELKATAKIRMRSPIPNAIVIGMIYYLAVRALTTISQSILYGPALRAFEEGPDVLLALIEKGYTPNPDFVGTLLLVAIYLLILLIGYGFTLYSLSISRSKSANVWTLFDGFAYFLKVIWMNFRVYLAVALWSLLLIVPGILASYNYRQTAFLLADHPDWSIKHCMRESKRLMQGKRMDLFLLDLSFIGWNLLALFPFVSVYTLPYTTTTYALFYNQLIGWSAESAENSLPEKAPWEY